LEVLGSKVLNPRDKILRLVNVQAQREQTQQHFNQALDEDELEAVCTALDKQRQGLQILTDVLGLVLIYLY
jgi:hypothetical protein